MTRIFSSLAVVAVILLLAAVGFGLNVGLDVGAYNKLFAERVDAERQLEQFEIAGELEQAEVLRQQIDDNDAGFRKGVGRATWHMLTGIIAGIVAILVSSISVTYFIGTSRWCKEVVDTYSLDAGFASESAQYKRKSFPWSFMAIVVVMVIVALGGASDPGTGLDSTASWALPHFIVALAGVALIVFSFIQQAGYIRRNSQLVERILDQVRAIRVERGLDVEQDTSPSNG